MLLDRVKIKINHINIGITNGVNIYSSISIKHTLLIISLSI